MSRNSLHRPRRPRAVWDRPAHGTRLLPNPFPPPGDGRSIDSTRHTSSRGHLTRLRPFPGAMSRLCRVPGGHRAPGLLPRRFPRNSPIPRRREGGYARPPPNGRERLGFIPLSGLPRLPPRRIPFIQRRQRVRAPIPPTGRALPAHGQA